MKAVVILFSVLTLCVGYAHCCRCDMIPTNGCNSDFSIRGYVLGMQPRGTPPNDERIYTVFVDQVYKANRPIQRFSFVQVRAYIGSSLCGIRLNQRLYVISGFYNGAIMRTNSCQYSRPWDDIPPIERMDLDCMF
uniref:NTR domain-containing protein n=1 Tax=Magallana gigas TaxID=29159 RepID=A0A8W8LM90_MAGGI